jgi:hypothetical protein
LIVLPTGYYWSDEIKGRQLGRDGKRRKASRFSVGKCERRSLEDQNVNGRIILK